MKLHAHAALGPKARRRGRTRESESELDAEPVGERRPAGAQLEHPFDALDRQMLPHRPGQERELGAG